MAYDLGDTVPLAVEVVGDDDELANATAVTLTIGLPDGTAVTPTPTNASPGRYEVDYVPTMQGRHTVRWVSTGPATAFSDMFDVRPATPRYLISLADAKSKLRYTAADSASGADEDLRTFVEACTDVVEEYLDEVVAQRPLVETVVAQRGCAVLPRGPVISVTSVAAADGSSSWDVADLAVDNQLLYAATGRALSGRLAVSYVAGYRELPASYSLAVAMILRHLWQTQRAGYGGSAGRGYGQGDADVEMVAGWAVPRAALELLGVPGPLVA
ncbi:MAG: hypothetical protein AB7I24_07175 [Candidatus Nanopelagicales bacterium]